MKTDSELQQDVLAELKWEPSVNAARIGVEVTDGVVTLAGQVESYSVKCAAERAAQRVSGLKALAVELEVSLAGWNKRTDADVARAAEHILEWTTYLPKDAVKVMVEDGWVTLTGELEWEYQRRSATQAVRDLLGVRGVTDSMTLRPKVSPTDIKAGIEASLKRRAQADAKGIFVQVDGADVTLSGKVHSWADRLSASHSAWGTPGVRSVVDNLVFSY